MDDKIDTAAKAAQVNLDDTDLELLTGLFSRLATWMRYERNQSRTSDKHMCAVLREEGARILSKQHSHNT